MPYIKQEDRKFLEKPIKELIGALRCGSDFENIDGKVNYVVSKIMKELYPSGYYHINKAIGVLSCIQHEFYRRIAVPYEEIKRRENGDI